MSSEAVQVGFSVGSYGPFHELAGEIGDLVDDVAVASRQFGDLHFHADVPLTPLHCAYIESIAELLGGHGGLAFAVCIAAAQRYFEDALPVGESADFDKAVGWVLASIMDDAGEDSVRCRDDVH